MTANSRSRSSFFVMGVRLFGEDGSRLRLHKPILKMVVTENLEKWVLRQADQVEGLAINRKNFARRLWFATCQTPAKVWYVFMRSGSIQITISVTGRGTRSLHRAPNPPALAFHPSVTAEPLGGRHHRIPISSTGSTDGCDRKSEIILECRLRPACFQPRNTRKTRKQRK